MDQNWVEALDAEHDTRRLLDEQLATLLAPQTGALDWCSLPSREAEAAWGALRSWVGWFRREFVFDHRVVPPCWYLHPALVSVLSALRDHRMWAYDSTNTPAGSSDWHRVLVQLEPRLRDWASRTGCSVGAHRPDVIAEYPDDQAAWDAHVSSDVAVRTARENNVGHAFGERDG